MDPRITEFYAKPGPWQAQLAALRAILQASPLGEEFKWRSPCYTWQGGNVVSVWALKERCSLAFFKGALLADAAGRLAAPGENSRAMRTLDFTKAAEIAESRPLIEAYLAEAIAIETSGRKIDFTQDDLEPPEELVAALDEDSELRDAFEALTRGRQRGYLLHFTEPKQAATRVARIAKARPRILSGKGLHDR